MKINVIVTIRDLRDIDIFILEFNNISLAKRSLINNNYSLSKQITEKDNPKAKKFLYKNKVNKKYSAILEQLQKPYSV
jgi:hypothetical protein